MNQPLVDILFITYDRLFYTRLALTCILKNTTYPNYRLWIVDNGSTEAGMVDYLTQMKQKHPQIHSLTLNKKNLGIARVTNLFWKQSTAPYVAKIDNDTLVHHNWLTTIMGVQVIADCPAVFSANPFNRCSHITEIEKRHGFENKISTIKGIQYWPARWVGGCCYVMDRRCIDIMGPIEEGIGKVYGWTRWQLRGYNEKKITIGYVWPPLMCDHMDEAWHPLNMKRGSYKKYSEKISRFRNHPQEDEKI